MQRLLVIILFTLVHFLSYSQTPNPNQNPKDTPIPFTLSDKERLIKIEAKTESLEQQIQGIRDEIQEIRSDIKWLAGMFLTSIIALVGFILWDRRTFLKPFESKAKEIDATLDDIKKDSRTLNKLIEALKEKSQQDEHLASILRKHHLL